MLHRRARGVPAELLALGYHEVLRTLHPELGVFTFWDYRMLAFPKNKGLRIDHFLVTPAVLERVTSIEVDRNARKGAGAGDHAPLVMSIT